MYRPRELRHGRFSVKLKLKLSAASTAAPVAVTAKRGASSFKHFLNRTTSTTTHHPPSPVPKRQLNLRASHRDAKIVAARAQCRDGIDVFVSHCFVHSTNQHRLNVEADDVACSVDGYGVIDINQGSCRFGVDAACITVMTSTPPPAEAVLRT